MAFDFNTVKKGSAPMEAVKTAQKEGPIELCELEFGKAKEQGDIGLMFYFHFVKSLYEAVTRGGRKAPTILRRFLAPPQDTLKRLQEIAELNKNLYDEYRTSDQYAIEHVIEVLQKANDAKK